MKLAAKGVCFSYGEREILKGLYLTIQGGSLTCLVGPNGSGKSTLLRLFASILKPSSGEIVLNSENIKNINAVERASLIGYLPQNVTDTLGFTVDGVIALGLEASRRGLALAGEREKERISACMAETGLEGLSGRRLKALSGGEMRRAFLASVMVSDPKVLLLDEPTAPLDPHQAVRAMELIKERSEKGAAVLLATHDLNLAALFADTVLLLDSGEAAAFGRPEAVFTGSNLESVYGGGIFVETNATSGRPTVLPMRTGRKRSVE